MRAPVLEGPRVRLEPFESAHEEPLYDSLHDESDTHLWDYLPYGPFGRDDWHDWFAASAASEDPLFFALVVGGVPLGQASYLPSTHARAAPPSASASASRASSAST